MADAPGLRPIDSERELDNLIDYHQTIIRGPQAGWGDYKYWAQDLKSLERYAFQLNGMGKLTSRAMLLYGYALLKAGRIHNPEHRAITVRLRAFAESSLNEGMAARWLLGRIYLFKASRENVPEPVQIALITEAHDLFSKIEAVTLDKPVLLPGILQEYSQEHYQNDPDLDVDPLTTKLFRPSRYRSSATASLSNLLAKDADQLLERAFHEAEELHATHPDAEGPRLNAALSSTAAFSMRKWRTHEKATEIAVAAESLMVSISSLRSKRRLSNRKAHEWMALSNAILAVTTKHGDSYEHAMTALEQEIGHMFRESGRTELPDFLFIDPLYRIALEGRYGRGKFRQHLEKLLPTID